MTHGQILLYQHNQKHTRWNPTVTMTDIVTDSRRHMSGIVRRGMADKGENHTRPLRGKTGARSCCVAAILQ